MLVAAPRLSIPLLVTSLLMLLGAPALAHPADADITCTAAAVARASAGLTVAQPAEALIQVEPTAASCVDKRPHRGADRITGVLITVPQPGKAKGTCGELSVYATAHLIWLTAGGGLAAPGDLDVAITIRGTELSAEAEFTGGALDGFRVSGDLANRSELQQHLAAACATEKGATTAVAQLTLGFTHKPWGRGHSK